MNDNNMSFGTAVVVLALFVLGAIGWVMNIVDIARSDVPPITAMFILRIVGIFIMPLGGVLGYL